MLSEIVARSSERVVTLSRGSRAKQALLVLAAAGTFVGSIVYQFLIYTAGVPPSFGMETAYHGALLLGLVALWWVLSPLMGRRQPSPAKTLWTTLLYGVGAVVLGRLVLLIPPAGTLENPAPGFLGGVPVEPRTVLKMCLLAAVGVGFAFLLLLRLRELVLFKRTRSSIRNWRLMLALMVAGAVVTLRQQPETGPDLLALAWVPAVLMMVTNSFRLSWIVFLSFREKMASIGLSVLLLVELTTIFLGDLGVLRGGLTFVEYYSYAVSAFIMLTLLFGILYSATTVLSLLFHLPTTEVLRQKVGEVAAMHSLTTLVSQAFDFEQLTATIVASPVESGAAHAAWLALADPSSGSLRPHIQAVSHVERERVEAVVDTAALYEEVHQRREPVLLEQALLDHRIGARPGDGLGSLLAVPLLAHDAMLGALFVTKNVSHGFERDDVEAIAIFAAQAALAIDHARLFAEQIEKERLSRELAIAREVQRKLLPQHLPVLDGVGLAASSVSAQEVGGDYFDVLELDDDRLAFIIADVSGKGTHAAFYMALMKGIFRSVSRLSPRPADFLALANEALSRTLEKHVFVSVVYGLLDLRTEEVWLARAGHCPVAMMSLGGEPRFLRSPGLGLGLDRSRRFRESLTEECLRLTPGDVFVLYTDGVVESRSTTGEEYGYDRLLEALRQNRHEEAAQLHDTLLAHLNAFLGHDRYDDDMTLLVLKWHGSGLPRATVAPEPTAARLPHRSLSVPG